MLDLLALAASWLSESRSRRESTKLDSRVLLSSLKWSAVSGRHINQPPSCLTCTGGVTSPASLDSTAAKRSWATIASTTWTPTSTTTNGRGGYGPRRIHLKSNWKRPRARTCSNRMAALHQLSPRSTSVTVTDRCANTSACWTCAPAGTNAVLGVKSKYI